MKQRTGEGFLSLNQICSPSKMVQIQYASDLHIDNVPSIPFESVLTPVAPLLVIAGDVCSVWDPRYATFLEWCSNHWSAVILIAGNHEYFIEDPHVKTLDDTDSYIRSLSAKYKNIIYLQAGQSATVSGIRFIGATLWSAVDPSIWNDIAKAKGDYTDTYVQQGPTIRHSHPSDMTALHALHKARIASAISPRFPGEPIVVITHHMPSFALMEQKYKTRPLRSCYASADDDLIVPPVRVWICGHSHQSQQYRAPSGTVVLMNARGYAHERTRFLGPYNPAATFTL